MEEEQMAEPVTAALSWLNDLFQWLGRWIPRLLLIHPTHRGVRFGPTGRTVCVGPGLVLYWPITHDLIQVPVTTQSIQLCGQMLPMDDQSGRMIPQVLVLTLNLQFTISDPIKAAVNVLNFHAIASNRAQSLVAAAWASRSTVPEWMGVAREQLRSELREYGIDVKSLDAAGMGTGVALKNMSDWSYSDSVDGKRNA